MDLEELLSAIISSGGSPHMAAANLGRELGLGLGRSQETPAEEYPRIETMTPTSTPPSVFTGNPATRAEGAGLGMDTQMPPENVITDEQIAEMMNSGMFVMRGDRAGNEEEVSSALAHRDKQRRGETGSFSMTPSPGYTAPNIRKMNEALNFSRAKSANEKAGEYDAERLSGRVSDAQRGNEYKLLQAQIAANLITDPREIDKRRARIASGDFSLQDAEEIPGEAESGGAAPMGGEEEGGLGLEEALMTAAGLAALYFGGKKAKGLFKKKGAAASKALGLPESTVPPVADVVNAAGGASKALGLPESTVPPVADVVNAAGGASKAPLQLEDLVGKLVSKSKGSSAYPLLTPDQQRIYAEAALKKLTRNSGQVIDRSASKDEIMRRLHEGLLRGNADIAQESALETALRSLSKR